AWLRKRLEPFVWMRPRQGGWRSARHVVPPPQVTHVDATPAQPRIPAAASHAPRGAVRAAGAAVRESILHGTAQYPATWSLSFVAVLVYIYAAVTYGLPLVTPAMVVAVIGLFMERSGITVPLFVVIFAVYVAWAAAGDTSSVDAATTYAQTIVLAKILLICFVIANITRDGWRMR